MELLKSSCIAIISTYILMLLLVVLGSIGNSLMLVAIYGYATFGGVVLVIGYLVWGLPAHLISNYLDLKSWQWYLFIGALPAFILYLF